MVAFSPVFLHDPPFQPPFAPRGLSRQTFRSAAGLRPNDSCSDASARPAWPSVLTGLAPLTSDHKGGQVGAQGPLTDATFRKIVARAGEAAKLGFPIHPHMPRHATGFKLAHDSRDTRAIQHTLGHKNIQHTVRDTELTTDRFKDFWPDERLAWCR
jgi:integrase